MKDKTYLIINADDFGLTLPVSKAIIKGITDGVISSTTALTVSPYFEESIKLLNNFENFPLGLHLTLTLRGAKPLSGDKAPSLIDENGYFKKNSEYQSFDMNEVEREWILQIEKFLSTGLTPTHLDSHHNIHGQTEELLNVAIKLAKKYNLPLRNPVRVIQPKEYADAVRKAGILTPNRMLFGFYGETTTIDGFKNEMEKRDKTLNHVNEMNCHPGYSSEYLLKFSSYNEIREQELEVLTSNEAKDHLNNENIELMSYRDLRRRLEEIKF